MSGAEGQRQAGLDDPPTFSTVAAVALAVLAGFVVMILELEFEDRWPTLRPDYFVPSVAGPGVMLSLAHLIRALCPRRRADWAWAALAAHGLCASWLAAGIALRVVLAVRFPEQPGAGITVLLAAALAAALPLPVWALILRARRLPVAIRNHAKDRTP